MAKVKALLTINENGNGEIYSIETNVEQNSISHNPHSNLISLNDLTKVGNKDTNKEYYKSNTLNNTKLNQVKLYKEQEYDGYMFKENISGEVILTIYANNLLDFTIKFDKFLNQYPTSVRIRDINGEESDEIDIIGGFIEEFTCSEYWKTLPSGTGYTTIMLFDWRNYDVLPCFKSFYSKALNVEFNKNKINSFSYLNQATSNASEVYYGLLADTGKLDITDIGFQLKEMAQNGYLQDNLYKVDIFVNDNKKVASKSLEAPYFNDNNSITFYLTNDFEKWKDILLPELQISSRSSGLRFLKFLLYSTTNVFSQDDWNTFETNLHNSYILFGNNEMSMFDFLQYCVVFPSSITTYRTSKSLYDYIQDFCEALQLFFVNRDDGYNIVSARPVKLSTQQEKIYTIPYGWQRTHLSNDIIVKNKYDNVVYDNESNSTNDKNPLKLTFKSMFEDIQFSNQNVPREWYWKSTYSCLKQTILDDYKDGIRSARITIMPTNYGDINWNNGETLQIGNIVKILGKDGTSTIKRKDGTDVLWKILGSEFSYDGEILQELELIEVI